ncbi:hypothetical protein [Halioxenophilus aromaticivorans]|uniref:FG-GAP repeat protein n=1 Tax=Halioxenophilus aromaticivorans TaxID=1306992 RepID=A0AAV3U3Q9_9ALTE
MIKTFKKSFSPLALAIGLASQPFAATADDTLWYLHLGGDWTNEIKISDGNIYLDSSTDGAFCDGSFDDFGLGYCYMVEKINRDGSIDWRYEASESGIWSNLAVNSDNLFLVDYTNLPSITQVDIETASVSSIGDISAAIEGAEYYYTIAATDNGLFAIAKTNAGASGDNRVLAHLNAAGELQWSVDIGDWESTNHLFIEDGVVHIAGLNPSFENAYHAYSTTGQLLSQETGQAAADKVPLANGISLYNDTYSIVNSTSWLINQPNDFIVKYDEQNNIVWQIPFFSQADGYARNGVAYGVFTNGTDIFAIGAAAVADNDELTHVLARYDIGGNLLALQSLDLPFDAREQPTRRAVALDNDRILLGVDDTNGWSAYVSALEFDGEGVPTGVSIPVTDSPAPAASTASQTLHLGDINNDGYPEIGVVASSDSTRVHVQSIGADHSWQAITFDGTGEVAVVNDADCNSVPEIAALVAGSNSVELRDSLSGELVTNIAFNANVDAIKMAVVPDTNHNGADDIAILSKFNNRNGQAVIIHDAKTGEQLSSISFNPYFRAKDFAFIEDINGDGAPEIAVLSTNKKGTSKLEIRALDGSLVNNIWLGKTYQSTALVDMNTQLGLSPNLSNELGVLLNKAEGNGLTVRVIDTQSGDDLQSVGYNWRFSPIAAKAIADTNGNGTAEIALLSSKTNAGETTGKIELRDSYSANLANNVWLGENASPVDFSIIKDTNGNGSPETVTLMESDGIYYLLTKDSKTGTLIGQQAVDLP